jgi:hypothetical protein
VNVTAPDECDWFATTDDDWITITDAGSGTGAGTVLYDVAPNIGLRPRSGRVSISGRIHTVSQATPRRCRIDVDPRSALIGAEGGTATIAVVTREGCQWAATTSEPWLTVTSAAGGTGSGFVQYRVDPNPTGQPRRAQIRIGGRTVPIRQQWVPAS